MQALVTGASGFVGRHLCAFLQSEGVHVTRLERHRRPNVSVEHWDTRCVDIADGDTIEAVIQETGPDQIFHLAACLDETSDDLFATNVMGTQNLLSAARKYSPRAHVLVSGSAAEYGAVPEAEQPIREEQSLRPISLYGVSKVAQSHLAHYYAQQFDLQVVRTRTFNLLGPGEPESLVCSSFAHQIVQCERKGGGKISVGSLDSSRDFVDVRDAVRAYALLAKRGVAGEVYNVCSGSAVPIRFVLETLRKLANVSIEVVSAAQSSADTSVFRGDPSAVRKCTQWEPRIPLSESLRDLLESCRAK